MKRGTRTLGKRATLISLVYGVAFCLINTPVVNYPCTTFRVLPILFPPPSPLHPFFPLLSLCTDTLYFFLRSARSLRCLQPVPLQSTPLHHHPSFVVPFARPLIHSIGICLLKKSTIKGIVFKKRTKKKKKTRHSFKSGPPTSPRSPFFLSPPSFFFFLLLFQTSLFYFLRLFSFFLFLFKFLFVSILFPRFSFAALVRTVRSSVILFNGTPDEIACTAGFSPWHRVTLYP